MIIIHMNVIPPIRGQGDANSRVAMCRFSIPPVKRSDFPLICKPPDTARKKSINSEVGNASLMQEVL